MLTSYKMNEDKGSFNYYENYHKMIKVWTSPVPLVGTCSVLVTSLPQSFEVLNLSPPPPAPPPPPPLTKSL